MFLAPTAGPIGIQPMGIQAIMINKMTTSLTIGHVVQTSFNHTSAVYPPDSSDPQSITNLRLSPFSCVVLADGDAATLNRGYFGVVVGLGQNGGAAGTEVLVQFGGVALAKVNADTNAIVLGERLFLADTVGQLSNVGGSANPDTTVAIALNAVTAAATTNISVLLFEGPMDGTATALT